MLPRTQTSGNPLPCAEDILRCETSNGITVLARASFTSPSVVIQGYLPAGSVVDPPEKLGLANFTAAALMRGTLYKNFQTIYETLEGAGASLGFSCGTSAASFGGQALTEDLGLLLSILKEALMYPAFPEDQLIRLRARYQASFAMRAQDTAEMAGLRFDAALFPGHPFGRPEDGFPETIDKISRGDLLEFHNRYWGPRGMVIVVVGGIEPQAAVDEVRFHLEEWQNPLQAPSYEIPTLQSLPPATRIHEPIPGKSQVDLVLGFVGPERCHPDFLPAQLGNSILGQFGLGGRLGEVVREKYGLAYDAYSILSAGLGPGAWFAVAGVDPQNVDRTIDLVVAEFRKITRKPVTKRELEDVKAQYLGRIPLALESNAGVGNAVLNLERYQLGLDYFLNLPERVRSLTKLQILEVAQKYLLFDHLVISTAGTMEKI
jgi:zinc protease